MQRRVICGHVFWPCAQGGKELREGMAFVALNMEKVVESMERTMRLQLKLTPRRAILAIRTRVLTFCMYVSTAAYPKSFENDLPSLVRFACRHSPHASLAVALL